METPEPVRGESHCLAGALEMEPQVGAVFGGLLNVVYNEPYAAELLDYPLGLLLTSPLSTPTTTTLSRYCP